MSLSGIDIMSVVDKEVDALKFRIKAEIFRAALPKKNRKLVANYYHEAIVHYMNVLYGIKHDNKIREHGIKEVCKEIHGRLRLLLDDLENDFRDYLKNNRKVSKYTLQTTKMYLQELLEEIVVRSSKLQCSYSKSVFGIVRESIEKFIRTSAYPYVVTYPCLQYRMELLKKIKTLSSWEPDLDTGQFPLDELLISMNFNSKTYICHLVGYLSETINANEPSVKIGLLLNYYKRFRQVPVHPGYAFNLEYHSLIDILENWFVQEISYLSKIKELGTVLENKGREISNRNNLEKVATNKVLVSLSSDQVALLLRAADETRMLSARSLNAVFRDIVPHISTKNKADLSYKSVRTKSYNAEATDKEVTIRTLQKMIEKIRDY